MRLQINSQENSSGRCEGRAEPDIPSREASIAHQDASKLPQRTLSLAQARKFSLATLNLRRVIGTGSSSLVRIAEDTISGQSVALKIMDKSVFQKTQNLTRALAEKCILSNLSHPLIVDFYGAFQDTQCLYLVMEFVPGGELYSYLTKREVLCKEEARFFAAEVAGALAYLHKEGVVYRDLKPENILISASGHIKLTDFGFAKRLKEGERTYSLCGTPHCMAPEVVNRSGHGFKCDWWMFGILLFEMLMGYTPFEADSPFEMYTNIITMDFKVPKEADEETASLLRGLLTKDPSARMSDNEVLHHSFFSGIHWQSLQRTPPPYVPEIKGSLDDSHFDLYENEEPATGTVTDQTIFEGY